MCLTTSLVLYIYVLVNYYWCHKNQRDGKKLLFLLSRPTRDVDNYSPTAGKRAGCLLRLPFWDTHDHCTSLARGEFTSILLLNLGRLQPSSQFSNRACVGGLVRRCQLTGRGLFTADSGGVMECHSVFTPTQDRSPPLLSSSPIPLPDDHHTPASIAQPHRPLRISARRF